MKEHASLVSNISRPCLSGCVELSFKLEACPSISGDNRCKRPISGATVLFLMQMGHAEKLLVFCKIETQSSHFKHANQASCELQFGFV